MFRLLNAQDRLLVHYSLFQLKGQIEPFCGCRFVNVTVLYASQHVHQMDWELCESIFKIFVPLEVGINLVSLKCNHYFAQIRLIYQKLSHFKKCVRPVYVICSDEDGTFQAPALTDNSKESACQRIGFGIRLLQTLMSELMLIETAHRKTFMCSDFVPVNQSGCVSFISNATSSRTECFCHQSTLELSEVRTWDTEKIWRTLAKELYQSYPDRFYDTKWIAFMACTRYDGSAAKPVDVFSYEDLLRHTTGYFALGTGGLALLGTGTLHTWPTDLNDLQTCLTDCRILDPTKLLDDSAYRHMYWAALATGLGSVLHELGHCFGLSHTEDGIMYRGGDDLNLCLGFPALGSCCPHGCGPVQDQSVSKFGLANFSAYCLRTRLPTAIQFYRSGCLSNLVSNTHGGRSISKISGGGGSNSPPKPRIWSHCQSLWHHGSAYWGPTVADQLLHNPWLVSSSYVLDESSLDSAIYEAE